MLKDRKGITLTTMVITIIVLFILMSTLVYSATTSIKVKKVNSLYNDLRQLNDAVVIYCYKNNNNIPKVKTEEGDIVQYNYTIGDKNISYIKNLKDVIFKSNDNVTDFFDGKLNINDATSLTSFFKNNLINPNDFDINEGYVRYFELDLNKLENISLTNQGTYIINERSHMIYYLDGVKVSQDETVYCLPLDYNYVDSAKWLAANTIELNSNMPVNLNSGDSNVIYIGTSGDYDLANYFSLYYDPNSDSGLSDEEKKYYTKQLITYYQNMNFEINFKLDEAGKSLTSNNPLVEDDDGNKILSLNETKLEVVDVENVKEATLTVTVKNYDNKSIDPEKFYLKFTEMYVGSDDDDDENIEETSGNCYKLKLKSKLFNSNQKLQDNQDIYKYQIKFKGLENNFSVGVPKKNINDYLEIKNPNSDDNITFSINEDGSINFSYTEEELLYFDDITITNSITDDVLIISYDDYLNKYYKYEDKDKNISACCLKENDENDDVGNLIFYNGSKLEKYFITKIKENDNTITITVKKDLDDKESEYFNFTKDKGDLTYTTNDSTTETWVECSESEFNEYLKN